MQTMNVALPDPLVEYIKQQTTEHGYTNTSDYIRKLVQADQLKNERQALEAEVLRGLQCRETVPFNAQTRNEMRAELLRRLEQKRG